MNRSVSAACGVVERKGLLSRKHRLLSNERQPSTGRYRFAQNSSVQISQTLQRNLFYKHSTNVLLPAGAGPTATSSGMAPILLPPWRLCLSIP